MSWRTEIVSAFMFVGIVAVIAIWWLGFVVAATWAIERVAS